MFDHRFEAQWLQPQFKATGKKEANVKAFDLQLTTELTDDMAAGIGAAAQFVRKALIDKDLVNQTTIPIDAVQADVEVYDNSPEPSYTFKACTGTKAVAKYKEGGADEADRCLVTLSLRLKPWNDDDLLAIGGLVGRETGAEIHRTNTSLPGTE